MLWKFQHPGKTLEPYSQNQYHFPGAGRIRRAPLEKTVDPLDYEAASYRELGLEGTEKILSVGAGDGRDEVRWSRDFGHAGEIVALDLGNDDEDSQDPFYVARRELSEADGQNVSFVIGDAHTLPFEAESFDVVTWRHSGYHFADIRWALWESWRALKPGGKFQSLSNGPDSKPFQHHTIAKIKRRLGIRRHDPFSRRFDMERSDNVLSYVFEPISHFSQKDLYLINRETLPLFENSVDSYRATIPRGLIRSWLPARKAVFEEEVYPLVEEGVILDPFERGGGVYRKVSGRGRLHVVLGEKALWGIRP